jgi:hypothetical protein
MKAYLWGAVILLLLSACSQDSVIEGISQDSGQDAKIEQARIDLDNSNYDQVISDLTALYTTKALDPNIGQLLGSAYMGKVGIDLTIYIANSSDQGMNPFDLVSSMIASPDVITNGKKRYFDSTTMPTMLGYLASAEEALQLLVDKGKASPDHKIQLGFASATHLILFMGNATKLESMPINTYAYKASTLTGVGKNNFATTTTIGGKTSYQKDIINIKNAVNAFSLAFPGENKTKDRLYDFLISVLATTPGINITDELIMQYSSEGLYNYAKKLAK